MFSGWDSINFKHYNHGKQKIGLLKIFEHLYNLLNIKCTTSPSKTKGSGI